MDVEPIGQGVVINGYLVEENRVLAHQKMVLAIVAAGCRAEAMRAKLWLCEQITAGIVGSGTVGESA